MANVKGGKIKLIHRLKLPGFKLNGSLVWFAAFKNHIGFYPTSSGIEAFKNELSSSKQVKGRYSFR